MKLQMYSDGDLIKFKGDFTYFKRMSKSVVVDGETYYKEWGEEVTSTIESLYTELSTHEYEYDFRALGLTYKILDITNFNRGVSRYVNWYSDSEWANCIVNAFNEGLLDERILDVRATTERGYDALNRCVVNKGIVPFCLGRYHSTYGVYYYISIEEFLSVDKKDRPYNVVEWFNYMGVNLDRRDKIELALDILKLKINDTSKQQKLASLYL